MADMTLEEALAAATVDEELVTPVNEVLLINPETRSIHVPDSEKLFGVRQDMSVERKYFKCPRIVGDNIDLSEHRIFINYVPSKQDGTYDPKEDVQGYWCKDLAVEGDFVTFSWKLSENVTRNAGYIAFAVYAKTIDEYGNLQTKWHTTIAIGNVLDTLPDGEEWTTVYPDIVMQLLERMDEVEKIATPESMQGYVDDYFNRNPMMIDRELKDATKAAPADIVGKLSEEIGVFTNCAKITNWVNKAYIDTSGTIVDVNNLISHVSFRCAVIACVEGDLFTINGKGGDSARLWCFIDADGNVLNVSNNSLTLSDTVISAPSCSAYLIINDQMIDCISFKGVCVDYKSASFTQKIDSYSDGMYDTIGYKPIEWTEGYYIDTQSDTVNIDKKIEHNSFACLVTECNEGDKFNILIYGGDAGRAWCFTDASGKVISVSDNSIYVLHGYLSIIAPSGSKYLIANARSQYPHILIKGREENLLDYTKTKLDESEFIYGYLKTDGSFYDKDKKASLITKKYLLKSAKRMEVVKDGYKVAVASFLKGVMQKIEAWYRVGQSYVFYPNIEYRIWIKREDETPIYDCSEVIDSVRLYESFDSLSEQIHINTAKDKQNKLALSNSIEKIMRTSYDISYANAPKPLDFNSCYGNNQNVHPKVLYIPDGFGGHKYWMAYTPYAYGISDFENPCVAWSDDGYEWTELDNMPLDDPLGDGYNSDTHLVYIESTNTLECWYRYVSSYDVTPVNEIIYRQTTTDGINWTEKEIVYGNYTGYYSSCLSPAVIWDGDKYCVWWVKYGHSIEYYEGATITTLTKIRDITLSYADADGDEYTVWHIDVVNVDGLYVLLAMCKHETDDERKWTLFISTSEDNVIYTTPKVVMYGSDGWDALMYRSSIVKVNDEYRIYYSALKAYDNQIHGIGISTSKTLDKFVGKILID